MERLQKVLAQAGVASRRKSEELILTGRVRVNGRVVSQLGTQVDSEHATIEVDNQRIALEPSVYIVLHKPRGFISDRDDTGEKKTALDLVPGGERLFAAGRLDLQSEGLLLLTNDGELTFRLTHPRFEHEKEYLALVRGNPDDAALQKLKRGIKYEDEWLHADRVSRAGREQTFGTAGRDETWLRIVLHEGKKRQIRHMVAAVGHPVIRLLRIRMGPLELGSLKAGQWRKLTPHQLTQLKSQAAPRSRADKFKSKALIRPPK